MSNVFVPAGRVTLLPADAYDETQEYHMLDLVSHDDKVFICKQTCTGITPAQGPYWMFLIQSGGNDAVARAAIAELEADMLKYVSMMTENHYSAPLNVTDDNTEVILVDELGQAIAADWKYVIA